MLSLTRKIGESIMIGDDIIVRVSSRRGNHIRLGIEAPKSVKVMRSELNGIADTPKEKTEEQAGG